MTISETIKNLEAIKERFGDLEVFVPEVIKYDDGISFKTIYHECMISAQSQRDGLIAVAEKKRAKRDKKNLQWCITQMKAKLYGAGSIGILL